MIEKSPNLLVMNNSFDVKTRYTFGDFGIVLLVVLLALCHAIFFIQYPQIDDAYITYSYAKNLAEGLGPVFSNGVVVEATSSPLWALFLVPFEILGVGSPTGAVILGLIFYILSIILSMHLCRQFLHNTSGVKKQLVRKLFLTCGLMLAINSSFAMWSIHGLENAMVSFLLIAACCCFYRDYSSPRKYLRVISVIPVYLLFLARPEGFIFIAVIMIFYYLFCNRILAPSVALFLFLLATETLRIIHFDLIFPNTFYVKMQAPSSLGVFWQGARYLFWSPAAVNTLLIGVLILLLAQSVLVGKQLLGKLKREPTVLLMIALTVAQLCFCILAGGIGCQMVDLWHPLSL